MNSLKKLTNNLTPFYQQIIDSRSGKVVGLEALMRVMANNIPHPPSEFFCSLDDLDSAHILTEKMLIKVISDISLIPQDVWVSVNVPMNFISNGNLTKFISRYAAVAKKNKHRLSFEITERGHLNKHEIQKLKHEIEHIKKIGFNFKLDDFGSEHSNISRMLHLGVFDFKIDKIFIDNINTSNGDTIIDSIISFSNTLNINPIAEGVETWNQVDYLSARGVHLIQGFIYSKPEPITKALKFMLNPQPAIPGGENELQANNPAD